MALKNPYFQYPGFPFSGYNDIEAYNEELIRLNEFIKSLTSTISSKVLLHITAGSAAEELYEENHTEINFLWQQLFPEHLQNSPIPVIHLIVSNSRMFSKKYIPLFVKNTPELGWEFIDDEKYTIKCKKLNITVKIFYTGLPSKSDYSKIVTTLRVRNIYNEEELKLIEQTNTDRDFTNMFYYNLENLFSCINSYGGFVSLFSYAVFRKDSEKGIFDGYHLFQEIKKLFPVNYKHSKRLLAEWIYRIGVYSMIIYNDNETDSLENRAFSFCKPRSIGAETLKHNDILLLNMNHNFSLITWENPFKHKKRIQQNIQVEDSNSLYNCLKKVHDDVIFWNSLEELKMRVMNRIINETGPTQLSYYLKYHDQYKILGGDINKYSDYICSDGCSNKGLSIREYLEIPSHGMILDFLEIEALSYLCKIDINIVNENNSKIYNTKNNYNSNIVLIYDEDVMIFKPKHMKFENNINQKIKCVKNFKENF